MTDSDPAREDLIDSENARVASINLAPGEYTAWHHHSELVENIFCLLGPIEVETEAGRVRLQPGERLQLKPLQRHRLLNPGQGAGRYLLVQKGRYDFISDDPQAT